MPRHDVVVGSEPFEWRHWLTCAVIAALVLGVIVLNLDPGLTAIAGAVVLTLGRAADERAAIKAMPWGVIMMVCGVTLLVTLLQRTGGMALFADFLGVSLCRSSPPRLNLLFRFVCNTCHDFRWSFLPHPILPVLIPVPE